MKKEPIGSSVICGDRFENPMHVASIVQCRGGYAILWSFAAEDRGAPASTPIFSTIDDAERFALRFARARMMAEFGWPQTGRVFDPY